MFEIFAVSKQERPLSPSLSREGRGSTGGEVGGAAYWKALRKGSRLMLSHQRRPVTVLP